MIELTFKIEEINSGFCRVLYSTKNEKNEKIFYSLQTDWPNNPNIRKAVTFYRNTRPPWCEPEYRVTFKKGYKLVFERPTGDTKLEKLVRKYIDEVIN